VVRETEAAQVLALEALGHHTRMRFCFRRNPALAIAPFELGNGWGIAAPLIAKSNGRS
jgi:hypothetical protein